MKLLSVISLSILCCASFAASTDDACISFSTTGPDRYADGSVVLDGECYALVWSDDGTFEGFTAAGDCTDPEDKVVLVAPVAKGGRCPPVLFQIPADTATALSGGKYAVYLLDTRVTSDGVSKPRGTSDGKPVVVNGYGMATATMEVSGFAANSSAAEKENSTSGQVASSVAAVPADCAQPKIKGMRVDGDNVYLTVENLPGFMRVQGGKDVSASDSTGAATETTGSGEDVILVAPKTGSSGFFKVIRNAP